MHVPHYGKRKTKIPILKRSVLSLKEEQVLHDWMVAQAIRSAQHLTGKIEVPAIGGNGVGIALPSSIGRPSWKRKPDQKATEL